MQTNEEVNARLHDLLYGPDALKVQPEEAVRESLVAARHSYFEWTGKRYTLGELGMPRLIGILDAPEWLWENREGKPWQADLEAHVAAYRAPAPPYSTDHALMYEVEDAILSCGLHMAYVDALKDTAFNGDGYVDELWFAVIHASPEIRARAAVVVLLREKE